MTDPKSESERLAREVAEAIVEKGCENGLFPEEVSRLILDNLHLRELLECERALRDSLNVSSGQLQVGNDDTEGLEWIQKRATKALANLDKVRGNE